MGWERWIPAGWATYIRFLTTQQAISIGLTVFFFVVTLVVYNLTMQEGGSPYNAHVRLANALLHGKLYVPEGPQVTYMDWAIYKDKYYVVEPPMPSIVMLPGVWLFGPGISQALVTTVIGAITASAVYQLLRKLTEKVSVQIWLTVLFAFGTTFWFYASRGNQTDIGEVLGVLFLVMAIYATLVLKQPFLAGVLLGMAYLSRLSMALALPFFVIMFSDQWLPAGWRERPLLKKVNLRPLLELGAGLGIFVILGFMYNYARFDTIWHKGYTVFKSQVPRLANQPLFDLKYIPHHLNVMFKMVPRFQSEPPYVVPSLVGMAIWATTPPFIYALFVGFKNNWLRGAGLVLVALGVLVGLAFAGDPLPAISRLSADFPRGFNMWQSTELLPFVLLIALAIGVALRNRDKFVLACWAAIIPIAFMHITWLVVPPQFGYRFALDYYPFLLLLTMRGVGDRLRWHHILLLALAISANLWGVLWLHKFRLTEFLGLEWVRW